MREEGEGGVNSRGAIISLTAVKSLTIEERQSNRHYPVTVQFGLV